DIVVAEDVVGDADSTLTVIQSLCGLRQETHASEDRRTNPLRVDADVGAQGTESLEGTRGGHGPARIMHDRDQPAASRHKGAAVDEMAQRSSPRLARSRNSTSISHKASNPYGRTHRQDKGKLRHVAGVAITAFSNFRTLEEDRQGVCRRTLLDLTARGPRSS